MNIKNNHINIDQPSDNPLTNDYLLFPYQKLKNHHIEDAIKYLQSYTKKSLDSLHRQSLKYLQTAKLDQKINNYKNDQNSEFLHEIWQNSINKLIQITIAIDNVFKPIDHLHSVSSSKDLRLIYQKTQKIITELKLELYKNKDLYTLIKKITDHPSLSSDKNRITGLFVLEFELNGINLDHNKKLEIQNIYNTLGELNAKYANNLKDCVSNYCLEINDASKLAGVPENTLMVLSENYKSKTNKPSDNKKGPFLLSLEKELVLSILSYADDEQLRKSIYKDFYSRASSCRFDNSKIILKMLILKNKLSRLLGYKSYAEISLKKKMVTNIAEIDEIHHKMTNVCYKKLSQLRKSIISLQKKHQSNFNIIQDWDEYYYFNKLKNSIYKIDPEDFKTYFPLKAVLKSVFSLTEDLFDIKIKSTKIDRDFIWHEDVMNYEIINTKNDKIIGYLMCDLYSRAGEKFEGAWMNGVRSYYVDEQSTVHKPVSYIMCNFQKPKNSSECFLNHCEICTLFHEMGHALQQTLSNVEIYSLSGTWLIERDAVELASQIMEYWCYDIDFLHNMSCHYKTNDKLDKKIINNLIEQVYFMYPANFITQITKGMIDLKLHNMEIDENTDIFEIHEKIIQQTCKSHPNPWKKKSINAFFHIFGSGYSAGYYSYLFSRIMASEIFALFEKVGLQNKKAVKKMADLYKEAVLRPCAKQDPNIFYKKLFNKTKLDTNPFIMHHRLDSNYKINLN